MAAFSYSRIEAYENCRLKYKFNYIDKVKVKSEDTAETFLGTLVHEALEKLYRDLMYEKRLTLDELLGFYNQEWHGRWNDHIVLAKPEYSPENYRLMGQRYLTEYYHRHHPFNEGKVIGLETKDFFPLDREERYKFHIRIDRLMDMGQGLYEIHDYKTNRKLPDQEALDNDRQLAMYSLWVRKQFKDFRKVRLVWHFLAFDKEMDSLRTKEQLEKLRLETLERIEEIEATEEFPASVSQLCDWCLYREICPMWKHEVQLESKPENEYLNDPGVKLVDEYVKIKEVLDVQKKDAEEKLGKLKQALLAFCKKENVSVVFGTQNKITVRDSEAIKFPGKNSEERQKLIDVLKRIGRFEEVAGLDVYLLEKSLQEGEWEDKDIREVLEFAVKDHSFSFKISKR